MRNSPFYLFDIETDGFLDEMTKIHCLSYQKYVRGQIVEKGSLTSYAEMRVFFSRDGYFVAHSGIRFDFIVVGEYLGINLEKIIDTLGISWYLYPNLKKHGLEAWGEYFGVPKPEITDWKTLPIEVYIHRCEEDVEILYNLFSKLMSYLNGIYPDFADLERIIGYLNTKMDDLKEQELEGITLNKELCEKHLVEVRKAFNDKTALLEEIMPDHLGVILREKPKKPFKMDGTLSVYGDRWFNLLRESNLPFDTEIIREKPNPGSYKQLQTWLFELGWDPITFKVSKSSGEKLPQVSLPFGQGICPSVKELYEVEPNLIELENYYMLKHRKGLFKSYLKAEKNGRVYATAHGFTNTLRLTHSKPIVNLPKPSNSYGKEVRECLTIPDESYIMCGSDVSSLEDSTKQHYIYFYDPEYVREMRVPGFDPHIDISVLAGLMTKEDEIFYRWAESQEKLDTEDSKRFSSLKDIRHTGKTVNFSATYGAGGPTIARTAKKSIKEGYIFHGIYWERNQAVKKVAAACTVKVVEGQKWIYNPVSGFYLFLKAEKDRFSTLNQSTGVYVFDSWLRRVRVNFKEKGIKVVMQYHDELLIVCKKEHKEFVREVLLKSMRETNAEIQLNVDIEVSVDFGTNYADCH